jgi:succinylarginine dihydrolase
MPEKAIDLFFHIDNPDEITTTVFFNACAQLKDKETLILAEKIFSQLPIQFRQFRLLLQSALNMFCRCNDISNAEIVFDQIDPDVIDYGVLMKLYNDQDQPEKTLQLFQRMK